MQRRDFLQLVGAASATLTLLPFGRAGWAATAPGAGGGNRLVVVFLRGAVDGLNVVVRSEERRGG